MIYILSQAIQTGKTSRLMDLTSDKKSIGGFLSPTVDTVRQLFNIETKSFINFEKKESDSTTIPVGRFHFIEESFNIASQWTLDQVQSDNINLIIIDELGKLELQDNGFHQLADKLLTQNSNSKNLLLIIRDFLLDDITAKYSINNYQLVTTRDIQKLIGPLT
jgi:nucleoside-triphosphatase THEP1